MNRLDRKTKNFIEDVLTDTVYRVGEVRFSDRLEYWDGQSWQPITLLAPVIPNNSFPADLPMTLS